MRGCPECGEAGIAEHSVLASIEDIRRHGPRDAPCFSRCRHCDAVFERPDLETLTRSFEPPSEPTVRMVPPWNVGSDTAALELSWAMVQLFYEDSAGDARFEPLRALLAVLREEGFGAKLRAGQSASTLVLSRDREHGLRAGQSHLRFTAEPDGRVRVEGLLAGTKHRFGPVPATFGGRIRHAVEALAELPFD